jgi:tRNA 2-thiouridine synthesizing protein A
MLEVDVRGYSCPVPVFRAKKAMEKNPEEILTVLIDTVTSKENVSRLARNQGYAIKAEEISGEYKLTLTPSNK